MTELIINENKVKLSNLNKIFWPDLNLTKGDLINYYIRVYPYIKDYLKNRPLSLKIYPNGVEGKSFFMKNCPEHAPEWLSIIPLYSKHRGENIKWITANKLSDLVWVANSASIELHSWFSTSNTAEKPDFAVFDLDPDPSLDFNKTIELALIIKQVLDKLNIKIYLKTSGKSGLHLFIPLKTIYTYNEVRNFLKNIADIVVKKNPELATTEWKKSQRGKKVYIDYRQNARSKTIPVPYSLRPTAKATVSTPLKWNELRHNLKAEDFTLLNIHKRLETLGDPWNSILKERINLPGFLLNLLLSLLFTGCNACLQFFH
jgi:bifunctional non-homologous end joining protein LigD